MATSKASDVDALAAVVREAAMRLSARDVATLVANPNAVTSALAGAAGALELAEEGPSDRSEVIGGPEPVMVEPAAARRRLSVRTQARDEADLLTSDELAARAGLKSRQSVHDWLRKGRILGWGGAKRGIVFPAAQLDARGRPLSGLERVAAEFPDGYAAWVWLTTPLAALDGETPLDRLRAGDIERVASAAQGDAQGDFA